MQMKKIFILSTILFLIAIQTMAQVSVSNLKCEMLINPVGIDATSPRLSWQLNSDQRSIQQNAFQLIVSSSMEKLDKNEGDVWNSGKVNTEASIHVAYAGKTLQSNALYFWKVKVFTNKGESNWSEASHWSMGLLKPTDWKAKWIGMDKAFAWDSVTQWSRLSARYLRKTFAAAKQVKRATAHISGLGLYELYINGKRIGDQVLAPAPTDYRKHVLYNSYDVTAQLQKGNNAIGVTLGNGRYFTMRQNYKPKKINTFGFPKLLFQLQVEYTDGTTATIVSDASWKLTADGPIRTNNEYDGEEYDANKELKGWNTTAFNDASWLKVQLVKAPEGKIQSQMSTSMKVMKEVRPVAIKQLKPGVQILDMGQNMVGWLQLKVNGKKGEKVQLRFAESLQPNGELYVANLRDAKVTDMYTLKGGGEETWEPSFVYHGFRYVEITGYPGNASIGDFTGKVIYDDLATIGSFESSNATINKVYKNAWWGIAGNYKGMPIDCPQRNERQPWLGDRTLGALGESFLFDNGKLYAKWLEDIEGSQTAEGALPDVAPAFWNYYSDIVTWPAAYITIADMLYTQYGDKKPIEKHYASMKKWLQFVKTKYMKNSLVTKDKYGDWCVPPESLELIHAKDSLRKTDGVLLSSAYYYRLLQTMQKFAKLIGKNEDVAGYASLAEEIKTAFNAKFYNKQKKQYDNNSVTSNLLPLYFGIAPDSVKEIIFTKITNKILDDNLGHISTGVIGTQWLMRGLSNNQRPDIAYTLASNTSYPSWGYMAENGATTIWELWNGNTANPQMNSQNHVMLLGDLLTWLYENLAGIKSDETQTAFKKIVMRPQPVDGLQFIKASYQSSYGLIKSEWETAVNSFSWRVTIPANATARLYIPGYAIENVTENGKPLSGIDGIKIIGMEAKSIVLEVGSGSYSFVSNYKWKKGMLKDEFIFEFNDVPESHASTITETPDGLIAAWFAGAYEGAKDVCIWTSRMVNGKWEKPVKVAEGIINDTTRYACYNPVLYYAENKELLLFYKIGPNVAGWTGWMMRSNDNGKTWSQREALPAGYLGPIKNKPVLIDGKLFCPSSTERNGWKVHFEITSDNGRTWTKTDSINDGKIVSAIQPSILTYADGRLQVLCRSKNQTINESWSMDRGKTWTKMVASSLPNNNSGTDAVTLKDGRQLLVYNHVKPPGDLAKGLRTPLNVAISKDGKNWEAALILEDSPISQYSYPSVIQTKDGLVHIVYTWRREKVKYVVVDPSKLETKPIVNGQWPGGFIKFESAGDQN